MERRNETPAGMLVRRFLGSVHIFRAVVLVLLTTYGFALIARAVLGRRTPPTIGA